MRGSIVDVYSYSSELPFRIDFFGDEVDTIRTFEVADQLSKDSKQSVSIVPELAKTAEQKQPFTTMLPDNALLVMKDRLYLCSSIEQIYNDGFSNQTLAERLEGATEVEQQQIMRDMRKENNLVSPTAFREEICRFRTVEFGAQPTGTPQTTITFNVSPQPLFHKNFQLLAQSLEAICFRVTSCIYFRFGKTDTPSARHIRQRGDEGFAQYAYQRLSQFGGAECG